MTAASYVPPSVLPPLAQKFAPLLKRKWFRELVLAPPTITGRRFSNKTEDYGVFMPSRVERIAQVSAPAKRRPIRSSKDGASAADT